MKWGEGPVSPPHPHTGGPDYERAKAKPTRPRLAPFCAFFTLLTAHYAQVLHQHTK